MFLQAVQAELAEKSINFNSEDKHVCCFAHVMNLAAQQVLVTLKSIEGNEASNENNGLIHKVDFFFILFCFILFSFSLFN